MTPFVPQQAPGMAAAPASPAQAPAAGPQNPYMGMDPSQLTPDQIAQFVAAGVAPDQIKQLMGKHQDMESMPEGHVVGRQYIPANVFDAIGTVGANYFHKKNNDEQDAGIAKLFDTIKTGRTGYALGAQGKGAEDTERQVRLAAALRNPTSAGDDE